MKKINGKVAYFNTGRGFGFLESRNAAGEINRFYLHVSKVVRVLPEEGISVGCLAQWEVDPTFDDKPVKPNVLPAALQVTIAWPVQSQTSAPVGGVK